MTNFVNLPGECWVNIPGYRGRYQVSNMGRVRATLLNRGRGGLKAGFRLLTPRNNGRNYMRVLLSRTGQEPKNEQISHLVAEAFCPNPHGYVEVDHINADRTDNRACNLQWCNHAENVQWGYNRRGEKKRPRHLADPDNWDSASGHLYIRPHYKGYTVKIKGTDYGHYPTLEEAVARRNEIMGW